MLVKTILFGDPKYNLSKNLELPNAKVKYILESNTFSVLDPSLYLLILVNEICNLHFLYRPTVLYFNQWAYYLCGEYFLDLFIFMFIWSFVFVLQYFVKKKNNNNGERSHHAVKTTACKPISEHNIFCGQK